MTLEEAMAQVDAEREAAKNTLTDQEKAFWEGRAAAKSGQPVFDNPYREKALFDERQLADWWNQGHAAQRQRRAPRQRAWNRA